MSQRAATITGPPVAFEVMKAMQADGLDWGEGCRPLGRRALEEIIEDQMAAAVNRHLDQLKADDAADRRNGYYRRHLLTELGDIELNVPRTRRYSPVEVIRAYARRTREIDRVILAGFVLGLSIRKIGQTLPGIALMRSFGTPLSSGNSSCRAEAGSPSNRRGNSASLPRRPRKRLDASRNLLSSACVSATLVFRRCVGLTSRATSYGECYPKPYGGQTHSTGSIDHSRLVGASLVAPLLVMLPPPDGVLYTSCWTARFPSV
jgi:Transposase, Mutator family